VALYARYRRSARRKAALAFSSASWNTAPLAGPFGRWGLPRRQKRPGAPYVQGKQIQRAHRSKILARPRHVNNP
jgi:hypothetical protein